MILVKLSSLALSFISIFFFIAKFQFKERSDIYEQIIPNNSIIEFLTLLKIHH